MYCERHDIFWYYRDFNNCPLCYLVYKEMEEEMLSIADINGNCENNGCE